MLITLTFVILGLDTAFAMRHTITTQKGNLMDQIKMQNAKTTDVGNDVPSAELALSTRRDIKLTVLNEWEMALASGGEGAVSWG